MASITDRARTEIESLHTFFCEWFAGHLPKESFNEKFLNRLSKDLVFIPPAGSNLGLDDLSSSIYRGYASNPDFRIQIRNVSVTREFDGYIVATYEEWQRNALASTPPDNGRIATVVFAVDGPSEKLTWLHIHETWLPDEVIAAGPYDF